MINVQSVSKKYGHHQALDRVDIEIEEGKIYAILGHNGAGKTTLIKCIMDLIPYEGRIEYGFERSKLYEHISVQMQTSVYEEGARVIDICKLYKELLNSKADIQELLRQFELEEHRKAEINKLSGGQKQKLSILLTLINNPKVVIFDELTTGLDVVARRNTWNMIKKLNKEQGVTVVMTSHFLDEVEYLSDYVYVLEKGRNSISGSVRDIVADTFGQRKRISFLIDDANRLNDLERAWTIDQEGVYTIEYEAHEESVLFNEISQRGGTDIQMRRFSFEDAFLKQLGYKITEKGEIKNA